MRKVLTFLAAVLVLTVVACGRADIGESCDEEGKVGGQCVDGAVCGKKAGGSLVCQKQCSSPADCNGSETCGNIAGTSLRGCRTAQP